MARYIPDRDPGPIIEAAREWIENCLVSDRSVFSEQALWEENNLISLDKWFTQRLDTGEGGFYEKLEKQLKGAPETARCLMAEILWALFLFPSNIGVETKRSGIMRVWGWSGGELDPSHRLLSDTVLQGIGSGGMGVNNHRWREIVFIVNLARSCKTFPKRERKLKFEDYELFLKWIESVPEDGERQFRHMLRYLLFPDRVERMSSNGDRRRILRGFRFAGSEVRSWTDKQLDEALLKLRRDNEKEYGTTELDFYASPLREIWKAENEADDSGTVSSDPNDSERVGENKADYSVISGRPRNVILYGPPGTGKTYSIQQLFAQYTDQPADVDKSVWEQEVLASYGWRSTIAATLCLIGKPARVAQIAEHPLIQAKAKQRDRQGDLRPTIWGYLQQYTPVEISTVQTSKRREPGIFLKSESSEWSLVEDWTDKDGDAVDLVNNWKNGLTDNMKPVRRYRFVTFHPSYSYEDFVIGLKPVEVDESTGSGSAFRMQPGIFKQICAVAKANPSKRYALFIDEINRANIAKVFGELISLIEPDKRARYDDNGELKAGIEVQLPGVGAEDGKFGVPENLDLYGTMNTADRSIALLDIALRRRFEFEEMLPRYDLIDRSVSGINLSKLLKTVNDRLEYLIDRDHRIGHAYFVKVKSLDGLRVVFRKQVLPLLQEYFFDDWSRVDLVLSGRDGRSLFFEKENIDVESLFGGSVEGEDGVRKKLEVVDWETWDADMFKLLYTLPENLNDGER